MAADSSFVVQLIQRAAAQDREAFSQLYDRFSSLVFSLAMRILRSQTDAEDLLQEVLCSCGARQAATARNAVVRKHGS
jgi:DNA-directed RNA polymerase specialized sigma24 family protein